MQFLENLKSEIDSFSPPRGVKVPQSNVLILGPVGAGKSSFFNTIASVFRGRVTGQAPSGCAEHSITSHVCICICIFYLSFHPRMTIIFNRFALQELSKSLLSTFGCESVPRCKTPVLIRPRFISACFNY